MSEFLAEARVLIRPDTTAFRSQLLAQLKAATAVPVTVPIAVQAVGGGIAAAASSVAALAVSEGVLAAATAEGGTAARIANTSWAKQAVLLEGVSVAAAQAAGSENALAASNARAAVSANKLNAGLLGLRTAVGSAAVIGLGALSLAAIAAGTAFRAMIQNTAEFEAALLTLRAVTGATAEQMEQVSAAAKRLGADVRLPAVTATDAAEAILELSKAGLTLEESIAGAEGVLQLATAAQIDNAQAALIAANALNSFGLAGADAVKVADALANAANASQGSITDIGIAMRQAASAAAQVGVRFQSTTALLSLFAKNGLSGSDAGTALRTAFIRLVNPTTKAAAAIKELGLELRDAQGNVRPDIFAQFGEATRNLEPAARDAFAAIIFGQDAFRAVAIGAREGRGGLLLMQAQIDQTGTAAEVAAAKTSGLAGAFSALQSTAQTFSVTIGSALTPALTNIVGGLADAAVVADRLARAIGEVKGGIEGLAQAAPGGQETAKGLDLLLTPGAGFKAFFKELRESVTDADDAKIAIAELNEQLQLLQDARVQALSGGPGVQQRGIAEAIGREIKAIRSEIKQLERESQGLSTSLAAPLEDSLASLEKFKATLGEDVDTSSIDRLIAQLKEQIPIVIHTEGRYHALTDGIKGFNGALEKSIPLLSAWRKALKAAFADAAGAQAELLRLQTEGGGPQAQIAALEEDIAAQRRIIAKSQARGGKPGAAARIEDARNQIKSDQAEIESIQNEIAADAEEAASKAKEAADKRDEAFRRQLEAAARPLERGLDRAALTETLADNLRFTNALIELYKSQIVQARKRIKDVETRNQVVAGLEDQLFQATLDRRRLQEQNRDRLRDILEERQEAAVRTAEIRVEFADLAENIKKAIQARLRLIAALKREARVLKLQGNALLENKLERARIRKEIRDLLDESKEDQNIGKQINFRILQQAQGFAANVMSNLIPAAAAAGTVSGRTPSAAPAELMQKEAALAAGRDTTVSRGQGNETNAILRSILRALETLNGRTIHPEATRQRRVQAGSMDTVAL